MLSLTYHASQAHIDDLRREAAAARRAADFNQTPISRVTLRYACAADAERLRTLAALDDAPAPTGAALVAEIDGRLPAALPLDGGTPIADPFFRGAELIELLRLRAAQLGHKLTAKAAC